MTASAIATATKMKNTKLVSSGILRLIWSKLALRCRTRSKHYESNHPLQQDTTVVSYSSEVNRVRDCRRSFDSYEKHAQFPGRTRSPN